MSTGTGFFSQEHGYKTSFRVTANIIYLSGFIMSPNESRLIRSIKFDNFLSFAPDTPEIELGNLNILLGVNGVGKSNFIEGLSLLRSSAGDMKSVIRQGGGTREWIWKGVKEDRSAHLEVIVAYPEIPEDLQHIIEFNKGELGFEIDTEIIQSDKPRGDNTRQYLFYSLIPGKIPVINPAPENGSVNRNLQRETTVDFDSSIIHQRRDPEQYPEIHYLAEIYSKIRIYREWSFGRNTVFREPQSADSRNDRLEEDFSNLGLFLNRLRRHPQAKKSLLLGLKELYEGIEDFDIIVEGGTVQVFFTEGNFSIPATRLSDGTIRYLCLLAILYDPSPPPLICIEEPELGLHPDIIPSLAKHLIKASTRTQLVVTTHSDILIDALTDQPESVLVCEKRDNGTVINRLSTSELEEWLAKYRLGELWLKGELGGTRW